MKAIKISATGVAFAVGIFANLIPALVLIWACGKIPRGDSIRPMVGVDYSLELAKYSLVLGLPLSAWSLFISVRAKNLTNSTMSVVAAVLYCLPLKSSYITLLIFAKIFGWQIED
jgi:chromate transport protein ChrA